MASPNYIFNSDGENADNGHKRSFSSILQQIKNDGHDVDNLLN